MGALARALLVHGSSARFPSDLALCYARTLDPCVLPQATAAPRACQRRTQDGGWGSATTRLVERAGREPRHALADVKAGAPPATSTVTVPRLPADRALAPELQHPRVHVLGHVPPVQQTHRSSLPHGGGLPSPRRACPGGLTAARSAAAFPSRAASPRTLGTEAAHLARALVRKHPDVALALTSHEAASPTTAAAAAYFGCGVRHDRCGLSALELDEHHLHRTLLQLALARTLQTEAVLGQPPLEEPERELVIAERTHLRHLERRLAWRVRGTRLARIQPHAESGRDSRPRKLGPLKGDQRLKVRTGGTITSTRTMVRMLSTPIRAGAHACSQNAGHRLPGLPRHSAGLTARRSRLAAPRTVKIAPSNGPAATLIPTPQSMLMAVIVAAAHLHGDGQRAPHLRSPSPLSSSPSSSPSSPASSSSPSPLSSPSSSPAPATTDTTQEPAAATEPASPNGDTATTRP